MTFIAESAADLTNHFADVFVPQNVAHGYDVVIRKFTVDTILFREIQRKKRDILMFLQRFQCKFGWNKVKYARITITHVCFIALALAGSLGRCLSTLPMGLLRDRANVNAYVRLTGPLA